MARKRKAPLLSLDEQLREHDRTAPNGNGPDRLAWAKRRQELRDAIRKRDAKRDGGDIQERNYPTVEISVDLKVGNRTRANITRVRKSEAWRHKQLTPMQQQAETEMGLAWQALTPAGLGASISRYGTPRGGGGQQHDLSADMQRAWNEWHREAHRRHIRAAVVLDCILEPKTLAEIERARRLRPGCALQAMQAGLDLWCELRGWVRPGQQELDNRQRIAP